MKSGKLMLNPTELTFLFHLFYNHWRMAPIDKITNWRDTLTAAALEARQNAYATYSGFTVGAALFSENGKLFSGCNVENASYGLSSCAERNAIFRMVGAGEQGIAALAVVGSEKEWPLPCGACLQVMAEFAGADLPVLLCRPDGTYRETRLVDLLPQPFTLAKHDK